MKNKKQGFTLAEALIAMTVVGVLAVMTMSSYRSHFNGIKYVVSNTLHSLDRALYNYIVDAPEPNPFVDGNSSDLCNGLVQFVNTISSNCNAGTVSVDAADGSFTDANVMFTAVNNVRFFISPKRVINPGTFEEIAYYIIYADINGVKGPNSARVVPGRKQEDPDVFAFAALDTGRVTPIGPHEFSPRYLLSRVYYTTLEDKDGEETEFRHFTKGSKPFYISKSNAWGYYSNPAVSTTTAIPEIPYTYNDVIRNDLPAGSAIKVSIPAPGEGLLSGEPTNCVAVEDGNFEDTPCGVIIDRYYR